MMRMLIGILVFLSCFMSDTLIGFSKRKDAPLSFKETSRYSFTVDFDNPKLQNTFLLTQTGTMYRYIVPAWPGVTTDTKERKADAVLHLMEWVDQETEIGDIKFSGNEIPAAMLPMMFGSTSEVALRDVMGVLPPLQWEQYSMATGESSTFEQIDRCLQQIAADFKIPLLLGRLCESQWERIEKRAVRKKSASWLSTDLFSLFSFTKSVAEDYKKEGIKTLFKIVITGAGTSTNVPAEMARVLKDFEFVGYLNPQTGLFVKTQVGGVIQSKAQGMNMVQKITFERERSNIEWLSKSSQQQAVALVIEALQCATNNQISAAQESFAKVEKKKMVKLFSSSCKNYFNRLQRMGKGVVFMEGENLASALTLAKAKEKIGVLVYLYQDG